MHDPITREDVRREVRSMWGGDWVDPMMVIDWLIEDWQSNASEFILQETMPAIQAHVRKKIEEAGL